MPKKWLKDELHRNEISLFLSTIISWTKEHQENAVIAGILFLALAVFIPIIAVQHHKRNIETMGILNRAQFLHFNGNVDEALKNYGILTEQYKDTGAGLMALLFQADIAYEKREFDKAEAHYRTALAHKKKSLLEPDIYIGLAKTCEEEQKYPEAESFYNKFLELFSQHPLAPEAYLGKTRALLFMGKNDLAQNTIQMLLSRYSGTRWEEIGKAYLQKTGY